MQSAIPSAAEWRSVTEVLSPIVPASIPCRRASLDTRRACRRTIGHLGYQEQPSSNVRVDRKARSRPRRYSCSVDGMVTNALSDGVLMYGSDCPRYDFASIAVSGGDSLYLVDKVLGHRQSRTTERYAHLTDSPVRAVASRASEKITALKQGGASNVVPLLADITRQRNPVGVKRR